LPHNPTGRQLREQSEYRSNLGHEKMAPETRRAGRDQVAPVSHENSTGTSGIAQDQIQFEMADAELMDNANDTDEYVEPTDAIQGLQAQAQPQVTPHADDTPAGSRASSIARSAFSKMGTEDPVEKQLRIARDALDTLFEADLTIMTAQQLVEHSSKQEAFQSIVDAHEVRLKRKRDVNSFAPASDSHANRLRDNKLEQLLKGKCPELSSASQSAFDAWKQLVNNKFMMYTGHDFDGTQRSRWALSGIKPDLNTLVNPLAKACDEADDRDYQFTWQMVQNLLQDIVKNPTVRRTELATSYFNCHQKQGQSVQSFADYLKNLEDRMDITPFVDGPSI
jgi:hypothetical protein